MKDFRIATWACGVALALFSVGALAADDALHTARGIALDNAIKSVCPAFFKVNAQEIDEVNRLMTGLVAKKDAAALEAAVAAERANIKAQVDAAGAGPWCLDQKARMLAVGGARMFQ